MAIPWENGTYCLGVLAFLKQASTFTNYDQGSDFPPDLRLILKYLVSVSDGSGETVQDQLIFSKAWLITFNKTCLKWPLKNRQNRGLKDKW